MTDLTSAPEWAEAAEAIDDWKEGYMPADEAFRVLRRAFVSLDAKRNSPCIRFTNHKDMQIVCDEALSAMHGGSDE